MRPAIFVFFLLPVGCCSAISQGACPVGMFERSTACWTPERTRVSSVPPEYSAADGQGIKVIPGIGPAWDFVDGMHLRIHMQFSDRYLESLEGRPPTDPLNQGIVIATADIRIRSDGTLDDVHLARHSRLSEFDRAVLEAIARSAPFPRPPDAVLRDGTVTVRWIFARPAALGCSATEVRIVSL